MKRLFRAMIVGAVAICLFGGHGLAKSKPDRAVAKQLFVLGKTYFKRQAYRKALAAFQESYRLSKLKALLYNVGRCYEALGQYLKAIDHYRRYLASVHRTDEKTEARLRRLKRQLAKTSARPKTPKTAKAGAPKEAREASTSSKTTRKTPDASLPKRHAPSKATPASLVSASPSSAPAKMRPTSLSAQSDHPTSHPAETTDRPGAAARRRSSAVSPSPTAAPSSPSANLAAKKKQGPWMRWAGWGFVGLGVASLAIGTMFALRAQSRSAAVEEAYATGGRSWSTVADFMATGKAFNRLFVIGLVTGIVASGVGATILLLAPGSERRSPRGSLRKSAQLSPIITPDQLGVTGRWTF